MYTYHFACHCMHAVIGWLNKQINEQMMSGRVPPTGPASLPLSTIRHASPLTSAPHMVYLCVKNLFLDLCTYLMLMLKGVLRANLKMFTETETYFTVPVDF